MDTRREVEATLKKITATPDDWTPEEEALYQAYLVRAKRLDTYGDGWLSKAGRSMVKVAVLIAGFEEKEFLRRVAKAGKAGRTVNIRTVENIMAEMAAES